MDDIENPDVVLFQWEPAASEVGALLAAGRDVEAMAALTQLTYDGGLYQVPRARAEKLADLAVKFGHAGAPGLVTWEFLGASGRATNEELNASWATHPRSRPPEPLLEDSDEWLAEWHELWGWLCDTARRGYAASSV